MVEVSFAKDERVLLVVAGRGVDRDPPNRALCRAAGARSTTVNALATEQTAHPFATRQRCPAGRHAESVELLGCVTLGQRRRNWSTTAIESSDDVTPRALP